MTPTPTRTSSIGGPVITYFGLIRADGCRIGCFDGISCTCPDGTPTPDIENGIEVFPAQGGGRGRIVVEVRRGSNNHPVGTTVAGGDPCGQRPSIQIEGDQPMGDGSPIDCNDPEGPVACVGGIPAVVPPSFESGQTITAALNEFACHFGPVIMQSTEACSQDENGNFAFLGNGSTHQFCDDVSQAAAFNTDTRVTVQVLDSSGTPGPTAQIEIRIPTPSP